MKERIGVYICHCGGNISDYVDVEQISKLVQQEDNVVIAKDVMFACADSNQKDMIKDIEEYKLDGIVVASCSPKLHLHTFRNVAERAGINPYNYVQVNIREQCSWPHSDKPLEATHKAIGLIRAGIGRVSYSEALENIEIKLHKAVAVIGAGVAGMRAAIDLARMGNQVYLIEKEHFVGGNVAQLGNVFMSNESGKQIVKRLYDDIKNRTNITLFTGTELEKVSGSLGNFNIDIKINPKFINKNVEKQHIEKAIAACNQEVAANFNHGLIKRKAIYKNYADALPDYYVADAEAIKQETKVLNEFADVIDLNQEVEMLNLKVGSVLVTTGFDSYQPKDEEFGYGKFEEVITLPQFKSWMEIYKGNKLIYSNKKINRIAFVYCVGNRQLKGENKYCSRYCCTSAIHTSLEINEKYKNIKSYHLYRDIRTYGKQEILYEKSAKQGDIYIRFDEKEPPIISQDKNQLSVKVKDLLTSKRELEMDVDLVVLVTGMVCREDSKTVSSKLKIPIGTDKFFNEIHPKLKPVETVIKGVFIGGSCQGPKNISESVQSSMSAAAKINALIKSGNIALEPIVARVNTDACLWCDKCTAVCDYDAIKMITANGKEIAEVNKASCTGCGMCAPVCPTDAIEIAQYTNNEIEAMIDGFMQKAELVATEIKEEEEKLEAYAMKEFPQLWKNIAALLTVEKKTIPELAKELAIDSELLTYHLMTMNKYSIVESAGIDDDDAYFYYKMKK